jgi:uncharacterized repeat protein (TIGR01451 family)
MFRKTFYFYISIVCFTLVSTCFADPNLPYKEDEIIVRFAPKAGGLQRSPDEKHQILSSAIGNADIKRHFKLVPGLSHIKLPPGLSVEDALKKLSKKRGIIYAQPNYIYKNKLCSTFPTPPNDPNFGDQWGLHNTGQRGGTPDADIDAPEAWDIRTNADNIIVAVLDTGIDYTHLDLKTNVWKNTGEIPSNGIDDDHNGYIDDVYGYNFYNDTNNPRDDHSYSHGTHCAGIIGAIGNNNTGSKGVTGVCWNVKMMAVKIADWQGNHYTSSEVEGIEYAVTMGAKVSNNSWGCNGEDQAVKNTIDYAEKAGLLFVAAAGNDYGTIVYYPAAFELDNIISVLATDANDNKCDFSNFGDWVDLGAPGKHILSCGRLNTYIYANGTSDAAPFVSGAAALLWSVNPSLKYREIKDVLLQTVDQKSSLAGLCVTDGRLNLYNAMLKMARLNIAHNVTNGDKVLPADYITYTISYGNPANTQPVNNVVITDTLPAEINYVNSSNNGSYNGTARTVTWQIGTLAAGASGSVTVTVQVNSSASPLGMITNNCQMQTSSFTANARAMIPIGQASGIIYVKWNAVGTPHTGASWQNAYTALQAAIDDANEGNGTEIWVAQGTYRPTAQKPTFNLLDDVGIYGGFVGTETARNQRNWLTNETILNGDINNDGQPDAMNVVTALCVYETAVLDGFTIKNSSNSGAGISINGGSPTIRNNKITNNAKNGIGCINYSFPDITNCSVRNNGYGYPCAGIQIADSEPNISFCAIENNNGEGIRFSNSGFNLTNCIVGNNARRGITTPNSDCGSIANFDINIAKNEIHDNAYEGLYFPYYACGLPPERQITILNNWIYRNGAASSTSGNGIYVDVSDSSNNIGKFTIRGNTIADNNSYGIRLEGTTSQCSNSIVWGNKSGQFYNYTASYSCVQNGGTANHNIQNDPCFVNYANKDYHLRPKSRCIDKGNTALITNPNETDIDGEERVKDGDANGTFIVDMGADEFSICDLADYNHDRIVNFLDYYIFANAWLTTNPQVSLDGDNDVYYKDLKLFCVDCWLWQMQMGNILTDEDMMAQGEGEQMLAAPSQQQARTVPMIDAEAAVNLLDEFWYSGKLDDKMTEPQYLNLRQKILDFMQQRQQQQ